MAVYSYCIAWAHERERLYEPTTLVEQAMQRNRSKHILFKRFECSSFKHFISFEHTSTKEMSEFVRLKTGNYIYFIAQADYTLVNL